MRLRCPAPSPPSTRAPVSCSSSARAPRQRLEEGVAKPAPKTSRSPRPPLLLLLVPRGSSSTVGRSPVGRPKPRLPSPCFLLLLCSLSLSLSLSECSLPVF